MSDGRSIRPVLEWFELTTKLVKSEDRGGLQRELQDRDPAPSRAKLAAIALHPRSKAQPGNRDQAKKRPGLY